VLLVACSAASAQAFSGGLRATLDGLSAQFTVEVRTFELADLRIAPVVTVTAALDAWQDLTASALGGLQVTWLPPESVWAFQAQVHYRVLWETGNGARAGPELILGIVGELW
jgi:hypothetical protein